MGAHRYYKQGEVMNQTIGSWAFILGVLIAIIAGLAAAMVVEYAAMITLVLIILFGYPLKKSVGTALILSLIMCFFTFTFYQILGVTIQGKFYFNWEFVLYLGIGSFISGLVTSTYVQKLSAKAMGRGMGITMIILGTFSLVFYFIT